MFTPVKKSVNADFSGVSPGKLTNSAINNNNN